MGDEVELLLVLAQLQEFLFEPEYFVLVEGFFAEAVVGALEFFVEVALVGGVEDDPEEEVEVLALDPAHLLVDLDHCLAGVLV